MKTTTNYNCFKSGIIVLALFLSTILTAQEYHIDNNNPKAVKLYKVSRSEQADINVYFVDKKELVNSKGLWFIGNQTPTSKPAKYVSFAEQADIKFYRVNTKEQAGKKRGAN